MTRQRHTALPRLLALACLMPSLSAQAQTPPEPPAKLDAVQVTAPAFDADAARQESSATKFIVSREELEKLDAASIGEILRRLPGVGISISEERRGRNREADRLEPRIVVDGEALPGGNRTALRLPVELIERIEIIKNSTAEFPSGAGGTINLILRDVPPKKVGTYRFGIIHNEEDVGTRIGGVYGDKEGENGAIWMLFANSRPIRSDRSLSSEQVTSGVRDDWDIESDSETGRENSLYFIPRFTRDLGTGNRLIISPFLLASERDRTTVTQKSTYADPAAGTGLTSNGSEREHEITRRLVGRLATEWKRRQPGWGEASARLSLQSESERRNNDLDAFDAGGVLTSRTLTRNTSKATELSLTAKRSMPMADVHLATFGLEARNKDIEDDKRQTVNGAPSALGAQAGADTREQLAALWIQDEWQIAESHLLTPGLRLQATRSRVTDALDATVTSSHTAWLPSLHYLWTFNPSWNIRSSLALSDKPAEARELSPVIQTTTGTNSLSNPDRAGNPSLAAERTATLQLGLEHFLPNKRGSAGLNLYWREIDDKLQRLTQLEGLRYVERPSNVGQAHETSVVADFKFQPAALPTLTVKGNATTSQLTLDNDSILPRQESARYSGNVGIEYEHVPWNLSIGGNLSLSAPYTRSINATTQLTQRARQQLDVFAVKKLDKKLSLRLTIDNLTREGQDSNSLELTGTNLGSREEDRARGVRTIHLSLEGKL